MKHRYFLVLSMCIASFWLIVSFGTVYAAGMAIQYDGKSVSYQDTQVVYSLDGETISSAYPGIIMDGISLASCNDIFVKSNMGITYKYSKAKGLLYLYHGQDEILFKLGSKTATVNGKKVTVALAPRIIGFSDKGTEKVYVPARFVAETFGFTYTWDSKTGVAAITSPPMRLKYDGKVTQYQDRKLLVMAGNVACNGKDYPAFFIGTTVMAPAKLTFASKGIAGSYQYTSSTGEIKIGLYERFVTMKLGSKLAMVDGTSITLPEAPRRVSLLDQGKTIIYVPLQAVAEALGCEYVPLLSQNQVHIQTPYAIKYAGEWHLMSVKGSVIFDGVEVEVAPAYSYLENDTAMLRAKKVFSSAMGCSYKYDSSNKTLTLGKEGKTIVFTLDSMTALVDGVVTELPAPARSVTNGKNGINYIMVPGCFTAETLGFEYEWINAGTTSVITTPQILEPEIPDIPETPDMPDTPGNLTTSTGSAISNSNSTWFSWEAGSSYTDYLADLQQEETAVLRGRMQTGMTTLYTSLLNVVQGTEQSFGVYDTYYVSSSDGFFTVQSSRTESGLELILSETISTNVIYPFADGIASQAKVEFLEDFSTRITFFLTEGASESYHITLSADYKLLTVRIYRKCLTSIQAVQENGQDCLILSGTDQMQGELLADDASGDMVLFQVSGLLDTLTDVNWMDNTSTSRILSVIRIPGEGQTQFLIQKKSGSEAYLMQNGKELRLIITEPSEIRFSLKIPYMPGTDMEKITDLDDYRNHKFTITLPGNQLSYLEANPLLNTNSVITSIDKKLNLAGNTVLTMSTSRLQAYKIHYTATDILVEVDDPKNLYDKIVVLDAGHGGKDPGAQSGGYNEKDLNLQIIYTRIKDYFVGSDVKVYWTRTDDTFVELTDRAAYASEVGADLFISLHMNSYTTSAPTGLSVYYATENKTKNSGGLTSQILAQMLQTNLISGLGATDRKVKTNSYVVCKYNTVPAVLIELGFISNPTELAKLTSSSYQKQTAKILYDSIRQIFEQYPTGR